MLSLWAREKGECTEACCRWQARARAGLRRRPAGQLQPHDFDWGVFVGGGAVAELPVGIVAPTLDVMVCHDGAGVIAAPGDRGNAGQPSDTDGNRSVRRGAVAELAVGVVP